MRRPVLLLVLACVAAAALYAEAPKPKGLEIRFIDVEGGQSTLFVTPSGESMLIDTGFPDNDDRDLNRVMAAIKDAGLKKLDYLVLTHYHADHAGNVAAIAGRIPIGTFVDHGALREPSADLDALYESYVKARARGRHIEAAPGDKLPFLDLEVTIAAADGALLSSPLPGAGAPNPLCEGYTMHDVDRSENAYSLGAVIVFGRFRMLDLGDLDWNNEYMLACPNNLIGPIDLYLTTHHGLFQSGADVLVHAIKPRVAIMNNGATKGGSASAMRIVRDSPGLLDFWQLHFARDAGEANVPDRRIANLDESTAFGIVVEAQRDGSFTVTNGRTRETRKYATAASARSRN
jgi:beta-lactamase superfamily II metal-dependent hydrolase